MELKMSRHGLKRLLGIVAILACTVANAAAPSISEERNAAVGFAITMWMTHVDALGAHCSKLEGEAGSRLMQALLSWQDRNMPYVNAAFDYMSSIEDMVSAQQGEPARQQFRTDRKNEFTGSAREAEAQWFPGGQFNDDRCLRLAATIEAGQLDLDVSEEFFPLLNQLRADMGGQEMD